jgi:hypothetical protein
MTHPLVETDRLTEVCMYNTSYSISESVLNVFLTVIRFRDLNNFYGLFSSRRFPQCFMFLSVLVECITSCGSASTIGSSSQNPDTYRLIGCYELFKFSSEGHACSSDIGSMFNLQLHKPVI